MLKGKVSDSVFGDALVNASGISLRLMFRNNRISTHDVNRGAIPFKDQVLAINHDHMLRSGRGCVGFFAVCRGWIAAEFDSYSL